MNLKHNLDMLLECEALLIKQQAQVKQTIDREKIKRWLIAVQTIILIRKSREKIA